MVTTGCRSYLALDVDRTECGSSLRFEDSNGLAGVEAYFTVLLALHERLAAMLAQENQTLPQSRVRVRNVDVAEEGKLLCNEAQSDIGLVSASCQQTCGNHTRIETYALQIDAIAAIRSRSTSMSSRYAPMNGASR